MGAMILATLILVVGLVVGVVCRRSDEPEIRTIGSIAPVVGVLLSVGIFVMNMWTTVHAGNVGVAVLFGDVDPVPLPPGAHFINPLKDVVEMPTQILSAKDDHAAASKDLQDVKVTLGANYHMRPDRAAVIYQTIGVNWAQTIIPNAERETLKAEIAHHNASDILQNRPAIKSRVQDEMAKWLDKYGIVLDELSIQNIAFGNEYTQAIEAKQVEEQRALQKTYELQSAEKQAEIAKAKAAGEANAAIEAARGRAESNRQEAAADADAIRLRATATAEANTKIAESLTGANGERVIRMEQIRKWSGVLPTTMLSGAVPLLELKQP